MRITEKTLRGIIRKNLNESFDSNIEFASNKIFSYSDKNVNRDVVIVKTKNYGNVAFYKRSGRGNSNSLNAYQGNNLQWLPFGGFSTELYNVENKTSKGLYTAWGADWLCKLPDGHLESDGTGKFLKRFGEFYNISMTLTKNFDNFSFEKVSSDLLVKKFFGKNREDLRNLSIDNSFKFKIFYDTERLYTAIAINLCLLSKGALKERWLPIDYVYTGSENWGKNILHDFSSFRKLIQNS